MSFHKSFSDAAAPSSGGWTRNPEWLALPAIVTGDKKVAGLYALFPDIPNHVALLARGAYTVDWGDGGATENVADNVKAEHTYSYDDVDFDGTAVGEVNAVACTFTDTGDRVNVTGHGWQDGTVLEFATVVTTTGVTALKKYYIKNTPIACTFTDAGDLVTAAAHGFVDTERVNLYNIVTTTGINTRISYYVINKTDDTFQLSLTSGGAAVALTTDGSGFFSAADRFQINATRAGAAVALTTDGTGTVFAPEYRQTVITVTPQVAGAWTVINFEQNHSAQAATNYHGHPWLDVTICGSGLTTIDLVGTSNMRPMSIAQQITIIDHAVESMGNMFLNCYSLQSVPLFDTSSVTTMSSMFSTCYNLQSVPLFDTSSVTTMGSMFHTCLSLQSVPLFVCSSVTDMSYMFSSCNSLQSVPLFDCSSVTTMANMFFSCLSLRTVPAFDFSKATTTTNAFSTATGIARLPIIPPAVSFSVANLNLDAAALDELYTNLPTVVAKTLTNSGCPGLTGDTPAIATAKGWTVTS